MLGAWAGHVRAQRDMAALAAREPPRDMRHRKIRDADAGASRTSGAARSRSRS